MNLQFLILETLQELRNTPLNVLMTVVTMMSESFFLLSILAVLYWCIDKVKSKRWAFLILFSASLNTLIKTCIQMPRPYEVYKKIVPLRLKTGTGSSFPSGHTQAATAFWGGAMLIFKTKSIKIIGSLIILLVAISRMYLGMHWPMDVVGGIFFGICSLILANGLIGEESNICSKHLYGISMVLLMVLIFNVEADTYKAVSAFWGMLMGSYLEQRYIQFEPIQSSKNQIKKIIVGILGLLLIVMLFSRFLPAIKYFKMIKYSLILMWITCGAPYCFKKMGYN